MKRCMICLFVICLSLWTGFAIAQSSEKEKAAVAAAEKWLSLVDSGTYSQSWKEASEYFRNAVNDENWTNALKAARSPLGTLLSRKIQTMTYKTSLPGAPDGEYVIIQFKTSFYNKKSAVETVTLMLEKDRNWRVSGYYIK